FNSCARLEGPGAGSDAEADGVREISFAGGWLPGSTGPVRGDVRALQGVDSGRWAEPQASSTGAAPDGCVPGLAPSASVTASQRLGLSA
ncbi:MAG: hypothetical protein PVG09_08225, partial [Thiohalocapsa sp.]